MGVHIKSDVVIGSLFIVMLIMRTREWYEDSIHSIISRCLPRLEKSNIRPAYTKTRLTNPFAVNRMDKNDAMKDGVTAVDYAADIVYFWLHFDPMDFLSTEVMADVVSTIVPFKITITCYGKNSMTNVIKLRSFFRTPEILNVMLNMDSVFTTEPRVTTFSEEINSEWYERSDLDINLSTMIKDFSEDGSMPNLFSSGDAEGYSKAGGGVVALGDGAVGGSDGD